MSDKRRSFERLCREHMRTLYGYISLRVSENDAGDLLGETMLSAWQSYDSFDERSSFKTWLFTIARRRICDHYRSREGLGELSSLEEAITPGEQSDDSSEPSEDFTADTVGRLDVSSAIASLKADERELIELVFYIGLDYAECAEVLAIPVGTVKSRMSAIRTKLKRRLGEGYDVL